ncbi:hypothetical protein OH76DRAFT_1039687 [Lentinus brumalis]|uniref:Uncharacterized protein n=1 Tax=Lentinus brumalis TaxID=2498619 RepID=A0A371CWY1_9APHY|nr:hypothetical protein OH76DRAFT_1039687 [Polyporus brumalis]
MYAVVLFIPFQSHVLNHGLASLQSGMNASATAPRLSCEQGCLSHGVNKKLLSRTLSQGLSKHDGPAGFTSITRQSSCSSQLAKSPIPSRSELPGGAQPPASTLRTMTRFTSLRNVAFPRACGSEYTATGQGSSRITDVDVPAFSPKQNRTSGLLALESRRMLLVRNEGDV